MSDQKPQKSRAIARTGVLAGGLAVLMLGAAFAAVPLYDLFCKVTGYGGTTQVAAGAPTRVSTRMVEVQFDANVAPGLNIAFKPVDRRQRLAIGQTGIAFYTVKNLSDEPVVAVATFNVTPHRTGKYFQKLECFCFEDRVFAPGAEMQLPVAYFVSPLIEEDRTLRGLDTITLSYTFHAKRTGARAKTAQSSQPVPLGAPADAG
jgi:cytochrome c oxidase assembly protein subunit 11